MKQSSKEIKIISALVILVLVFLFSYNVTMSYFTATASIKGRLGVPNLDVSFGTWSSATSEGTRVSDSIQIYPLSSNISRGQTFHFSLTNGGSKIDTVSLMNTEDSCDAYVRIYVEAYEILGADSYGTTDYGQYFELGILYGTNFVSGNLVYSKYNDKVTYFYNQTLSLQEGEEGYVDQPIFDTMRLSTTAPASIMGKQFKITISLDDIQSANEAFKSWDKTVDGRGYCSSWS